MSNLYFSAKTTVENDYIVKVVSILTRLSVLGWWYCYKKGKNSSGWGSPTPLDWELGSWQVVNWLWTYPHQRESWVPHYRDSDFLHQRTQMNRKYLASCLELRHDPNLCLVVFNSVSKAKHYLKHSLCKNKNTLESNARHVCKSTSILRWPWFDLGLDLTLTLIMICNHKQRNNKLK